MHSTAQATSDERVTLHDVAVDIRVGASDRERHADARQRVLVTVEMGRGGRHRHASLADCLDYARVFAWITDTWPQRPHTELLETLLEELVAFVFEDARVEWCRVAIKKPHVFHGVAVPEVAFFREREA
ncbi:MAG: dihydroneopterin aldolase [Myxococcales bacterium]|nr:dihydroneopterin aldolase [Myxococcales bacterium]